MQSCMSTGLKVLWRILLSPLKHRVQIAVVKITAFEGRPVIWTGSFQHFGKQHQSWLCEITEYVKCRRESTKKAEDLKLLI